MLLALGGCIAAGSTHGQPTTVSRLRRNRAWVIDRCTWSGIRCEREGWDGSTLVPCTNQSTKRGRCVYLAQGCFGKGLVSIRVPDSQARFRVCTFFFFFFLFVFFLSWVVRCIFMAWTAAILFSGESLGKSQQVSPTLVPHTSDSNSRMMHPHRTVVGRRAAPRANLSG